MSSMSINGPAAALSVMSGFGTFLVTNAGRRDVTLLPAIGVAFIAYLIFYNLFKDDRNGGTTVLPSRLTPAFTPDVIISSPRHDAQVFNSFFKGSQTRSPRSPRVTHSGHRTRSGSEHHAPSLYSGTAYAAGASNREHPAPSLYPSPRTAPSYVPLTSSRNEHHAPSMRSATANAASTSHVPYASISPSEHTAPSMRSSAASVSYLSPSSASISRGPPPTESSRDNSSYSSPAAPGGPNTAPGTRPPTEPRN